MLTAEITTKSGTKTLAWQFWDGQKLSSHRHCPMALDTETEMITDERRIPRLALAVASDRHNHTVIHPDRLGEFLLQHKEAHFVGHNVAFDFWVINQHLKQSGEPEAGRVLWEACDQGRLFDTQILDLLLQLGTGKFRKTGVAKGKDNDVKVYPGNLADVAVEYTTLRISKDDPYRQRFGELVGLSFERWTRIDPGFFTYAVRDAVTTRQLYPALADHAHRLMIEFGFDRRKQRYDVRPDAIDRFGYLSEVIQVKANVVLVHLFRRGVRVNLEKARALKEQYLGELATIVAELERSYPEVLTFTKDGLLKLTPRSQTPSLGPKKLQTLLLQVIAEMKERGHDVLVPVSNGKKKGMSLSVKAWGQYTERHPFLDLWVRMKKLEKLLGFLNSMTAETLHGQYSLLTRTGRTSCSKPRNEMVPGLNVQQMPKLPEFRALFIPDPGHKLFVGDFAAAELRTLAAVCRARFGFSKLGDVITQKIDPHAFTAATIQGLSPADFQKLEVTDPERFEQCRQRSKAINFGVPGGMGAKALQEYALSNYRVTLTLEEAQQFRKQLITEVYPELNDRDGYLADTGMGTLARNLGVTEREVWDAFDRSGQRNPLAAWGVAKVIRGRSTASNRYQGSVWAGLRKLLNTVIDPDPEIAEMIAREQGSQQLHALLYRQSVATLTGRLRAGVGYTDSKNTPFQSLCADGAKLALWNLLYAGYDVYAFVHDETLVQIPAGGAEEHANQIRAIKVKSMEEVMGHGIPAACKFLVADCWRKP